MATLGLQLDSLPLLGRQAEEQQLWEALLTVNKKNDIGEDDNGDNIVSIDPALVLISGTSRSGKTFLVNTTFTKKRHHRRQGQPDAQQAKVLFLPRKI